MTNKFISDRSLLDVSKGEIENIKFLELSIGKVLD